MYFGEKNLTILPMNIDNHILSLIFSIKILLFYYKYKISYINFQEKVSVPKTKSCYRNFVMEVSHSALEEVFVT